MQTKAKLLFIRLLWLLLLVAIAFVSVQALVTRSTQSHEQQTTLHDLHSFEPVRMLFNQDAGYVRLVALLSPT